MHQFTNYIENWKGSFYIISNVTIESGKIICISSFFFFALAIVEHKCESVSQNLITMFNTNYKPLY